MGIECCFIWQVQFELLKDVDAVFGVRYDVTSYLTKGDYNAVVDKALGLRTDNNASDWNNPAAAYATDFGM